MNTTQRVVAVVVTAFSLMTSGEASVKTDNTVLLPVKNDPTVCFRIWFKTGSQYPRTTITANTGTAITPSAPRTLCHPLPKRL